MSRNTAVRVGVITLALSLIVLGAAWLTQNLTSYPVMSQLTRWWPVLLILLGLEYLWRHYRYGPETPVRWSVGSLLLIFLICGGLATAAWVPSTPLVHMRDIMHQINPVQAQKSFNLEPVADFKGKTVRIENNTGTTQVNPASDGQIHIRGTMNYREWEQSPEFQPGEVKVIPGDPLVITAEKTEQGVDWLSVNYNIEIPPGLNVEITNSTGMVTVSGVVGDLNIVNRLGEVEVKDCQGKVAVRNDSGNIRLENVQGNTALQSRLGMISVKDFKGSLVAESNSGQINVRTDKPVEENWDIKTSLGSIDVQIPGSSSVLLEAETELGSVSGSREIVWQTQGSKKMFRLGDGRGTIQMRADRGSINVRLEG